jgi:L-ribulokinase
MSIVAGVDFATQKHCDHMTALVSAMRKALDAAGMTGDRVEAIAVATTGSSVVPVGEGLVPLDDYYLWCDHRAWREAARITETAHRTGLRAIELCGGTYSSEWGFSKLLHWLRNNPDKRGRFVTALEHCDMAAATLCGVTDPALAPRSICSMGHKWLWNESLGGLPPEEFLVEVDPLLAGVRGKLNGVYGDSDKLAGALAPAWAEKLGLPAGIPIPVGAFDAHWDAIGAGIRVGDAVNVVGSSTCIVAVAENVSDIPGVCGVVQGSVHPSLTGVEAGLSATGDLFEAISARANSSAAEPSRHLNTYKAGQTGLLRFAWDNGDRTVLVNPELGGITFGWNMVHRAVGDVLPNLRRIASCVRGQA